MLRKRWLFTEISTSFFSVAVNDLDNQPSFILSSRLKLEIDLHVFKSKITSFTTTFIPIQLGAFNTLAKYSGYPFFHHPTLVLSG